MSVPYPFGDPLFFARWLLGFTVVVLVPGWLLIGRYLAGWDAISRVVASYAAGLIVVPLISQGLTALGVPLAGWLHIVVVLVLAFALARAPSYRPAVAAVAADIPPLNRRGQVLVAVFCLVLFGAIAVGFRGLSSPPHLYDASNHSFLALRILATRSLDTLRHFDPWGLPAVPYLAGWHSSAALSADLAGIAPYISVWYLSALAAATFPAGFVVFWRACRVSTSTSLLAAALALGVAYVPTGLYAWGGFGAIVGMSLVFWLVLTLRALPLRPSRAGAALAGLSAVALVHIHATEIVVAGLLLWAAWPDGRPSDVPRRRWLAAAAVLAAVLVFGGLTPLLAHVEAYERATASAPLAATAELGAAWRDFLLAAGGWSRLLQWLVVPAVVAGLLLRRRRRLAILAVGVALFYFAMRLLKDPITLELGRVFYRQPARVLYVMPFLMPPLVATALLWLWDRFAKHTGRTPRRALVTAAIMVLAIAAVWPGIRRSAEHLAGLAVVAPFTADDYRLATELASLEPRDAEVANLEADGSFWAMHVSGRRFVDPTGWELGRARPDHGRALVPLLKRRPWPPEVAHLREEGVAFVWVSDRLVRGAIPLLSRSDLDGDDRFEPVLADDETTVYRILWKRGGFE